MKTDFNGEHADYAYFSSNSLDPFPWALNPDTTNWNTNSTSSSPSHSSPSPTLPSSAIVNSPVALQEVSLQIPSTLSSASMSPSTTSVPLQTLAIHEYGSRTTSPRRNKNSIPPSKTGYRSPIVKPSPVEEELVRRIHRKVGGPAKLSTYDDPAKVRHVVIEALAKEQSSDVEACRIRKGQLSVFERRVVRTVTNRGAAVRSRMRQRKEMAHLRQQLRLRDVRVNELESVVRALCSAYAVPLPPSVGLPRQVECSLNVPTHNEASKAVAMAAEMAAVEAAAATVEVMSQGEEAEAMGYDRTDAGMNSSQPVGFQQPMFGVLGQDITYVPWS